MNSDFHDDFSKLIAVPWKRLVFSVVFVVTVCSILAGLVWLVLTISKYLFVGLIFVFMVLWVRNLNRALGDMHEESEMLDGLWDRIKESLPDEFDGFDGDDDLEDDIEDE